MSTIAMARIVFCIILLFSAIQAEAEFDCGLRESASHASEHVETEHGCDVPELVSHHPEYNGLVCAGMAYLDGKDFANAAQFFEKALAIKIHEWPNFELFPKLAWAHFKAGNPEKAKVNLLKAELALSVLVGIAKCRETATDILLVDRHGNQVTGAYAEDIRNRMCAVIHDSYYGHSNLEQVLADSERIRRYFEIRDRIEKAILCRSGGR